MSGDERIYLKDTVAGTDVTDTVYLHNQTGHKLLIEQVDLMPNVTTATHASNYITTTITCAGGTLASHTTDSATGSALTAGTVKNLTLAGAYIELAVDGKITVAVAKAGTGPAYEAQVLVKARRMRQ